MASARLSFSFEIDKRPAMPPAAFALDPATLTASIGEKRAKLTGREFAVLAALIEADGATVPHQALLHRGWGPNTPLPNLRVAIAGLRRKLEPDPELPTLILSESGVGYRLSRH